MRKLMEILKQVRYPEATYQSSPTNRNRRKKPAPKWVEPAFKYTAIIMVIATTISIPTWLWQSGSITRGLNGLWQKTIIQTASLGFKIDKVTLQGRYNASRQDIIRAARLKRGDPIIGFNIDLLHQRLVKLPWVRAAVIKRHWPDKVGIQITERQPMALWQRNGKLHLIDKKGILITSRNLRRFRNLLIVVGNGAPTATATLLTMLASQPILARRVKAAELIGQRRWNLRLKGGIKIKLPEQNSHKAWQRLANLNNSKKIFARDIETIDMRIPQRLLIRSKIPSSKTIRAKGQRT